MNNKSHNSRSDGRRYFLNSLSCASLYSDIPRPQADYEQTYRLLPVRNQSTQTDSNMYPVKSYSPPDEKEDSGCSTFTYDPMSCADEASTQSDNKSVFASDSSFVGTEEMPRLLMKSAIRVAMDNLIFSRLKAEQRSAKTQSNSESEDLQSEAGTDLSSVIKTMPKYTPHEGDYLGPESWTLALQLQDALKDLNNGVCEHLERLGKIPHPTKKSTQQQESMVEPSEDEQVLMYVASATDRLHQKKKLEQERMAHSQKTKSHPSRAEDLKSYFGDMKKMVAHEVIMPVQLRVVTQMKRSLEEMIYLTKAMEQMSTSADSIFKEAYEMDQSSKKH